MGHLRNLIVAAVLLCLTAPGWAAQPRVFLLDAQMLESRRAAAQGEQPSASATAWVQAADRQARAALKAQVPPVTSKQASPPSGDKHDYMSQAPYFWPDPSKTSGLPYIRKDGERNPEIKKYPDHDLLDRMIDTVSKLALGYYATGNEAYAKRAADVLRLWFVDPETRMNPNLNFAQAVPGVNSGRGIGIIETRGLPRVVDAVGLLGGSKNWTTQDQQEVETWFAKFLDWLQTSKNGRDESNAKNNHGTYYDVQIAAFALFVHKEQLARAVLEASKAKRLSAQIEPDGRQPLELERTKSWSYSTMNLEGLIDLATLAQSVGVDLWNYHSADGRGIRKAIDFLYPYTRPGGKWPFKQIEPLEAERLYSSMRRAAAHYKDAAFDQMMSTVPANQIN